MTYSVNNVDKSSNTSAVIISIGVRSSRPARDSRKTIRWVRLLRNGLDPDHEILLNLLDSVQCVQLLCNFRVSLNLEALEDIADAELLVWDELIDTKDAGNVSLDCLEVCCGRGLDQVLVGNEVCFLTLDADEVGVLRWCCEGCWQKSQEIEDAEHDGQLLQ